jgi:hypothetical protein
VSKTKDIEDAIILTLHLKGACTHAELKQHLLDGCEALRSEDPRWIGAALSHLESTGKVRISGWNGNDTVEEVK